MTAEEIHRILDDAGLAPPVHYCALPFEWRTALELIESRASGNGPTETAKRIEQLEATIADAISTLEDA